MSAEMEALVGDMSMEATEEDLKKPRRYFTSKIYHRAIKHALKKGATAEVAQQAGRSASGLASDVYSKGGR